MADQPTVVRIGENSPEQVAYKLLQEIAKCENVVFYSNARESRTATRKWILTTCGQCLRTVRAGAMPKALGDAADQF